MKKILIILCLLFSFCLANTLEECYKLYPYDADTTFINALDAISANSQFEISEIQSANGYILFVYGSKFYLLTVTKRYQNQTEIKILPQNSDFSEGNEIAKMLFSMIDNKIKYQPMGQVN